MDNDSLTTSLAKLARQEAEDDHERFDARWNALAAGTLPAEEEAALVRDPRMALAYEAFRPLGASFQGRMVEQIRQQLTAGRGEATPWPPRTSAAQPQPTTPARRRSWQPWALAAALLATIGLTLLLPSPPKALPEYAMTFDGMTRQERSATPATATGALEFAAGNLFSMVLQPATSFAEAVEARFFLARQGELMAWTPAVEKAPSGAFKIVGRLGHDIELPAGDWQLIVVIAQPSHLPDLDSVRGLVAGQEPPPAWVVLRQALRISGGG